jgi:DMSO/TMAO reductase YedYZ heme-binding membrane subunit
VYFCNSVFTILAFDIDSLRSVHRILVVSSFAKLLAIPAVIWAQTHSTIYFLLTRVLVFTSNVAAFKGQYSRVLLQQCVTAGLLSMPRLPAVLQNYEAAGR